MLRQFNASLRRVKLGVKARNCNLILDMNSKTRCNQCNKDFITRKDLTDHNANERKQGRILGHEVQTKTGQSTAGSTKGSQVGTKDTKMNDVGDFDIPDTKKVK